MSDKIKKIVGRKTVGYLRSLYEENKKGASFFLCSSTRSFVLKYKKGKLSSNPLNEMVHLTVEDKDHLQQDEYEYRFDLIANDVVKPNFDSSENIDENISELAMYFKNDLLSQLKKLINHNRGREKCYNANDLSDKEQSDVIKLMTKLLLEDPKVDEKLKHICLLKLTEKQNETIHDTSFMKDKAYVVKMIKDLDTAIAEKQFFTIEELEKTSHKMNINGENIQYKSKKFGVENLSITNSRHNITAYSDANSYVFFDKDEALRAAKEKVRELRKALMEFERVVF